MAHAAPSVTFAATLASVLATAPAQQGHAADPGPGPLVCFSIAERIDGAHHVVLHLADCLGDAMARPFWTNRGNARVLARLDRTRLLVASHGEPYGLLVVDAAEGTHRELAPGCASGLVAVHGDDVLYLGDNRWGKGDHHLYARSWREPGPPRRLAEPLFGQVPLVRGNLAIGIAAGGRDVWAVSLTRAQGRRVHTLPAGALNPRVALSPSGQRLAVGCAVDGRGQLTVVDLGTGDEVQTWKDLNIELSPFSSFLPTLEVGFHDDTCVVSAETDGNPLRGGQFVLVRRALADGGVTGTTPLGPVGLYHPKPPDPDQEVMTPTFELLDHDDRRELRRPGSDAPVASVPRDQRRSGSLELSPDAAFAVLWREAAPAQVLLYRDGRPPLGLHGQQGFDYTFLPAR